MIADRRKPSADHPSPSRTSLLRVLVITFGLLATQLIIPNSARASIKVDWNGGRLSILAEKAPLGQVIKEVARQTGIELRGLEKLKKEDISVHIMGVGLAQGLENLLGQVDHAILEGEPSQGRACPLTVVIFGDTRSPHQAGGAGQYAAAGGGTEPADEAEDDPPNETASTGAEAVEGQAAGEESQVKRLRAVQHAAAGDDDETLRKALLDPDPLVHGDALQALAARDGGGAVEVLLGALKNGDSAARLQALLSLDQSGTADEGTVLSALHDALSDSDMAVMGYAIQALARRGGPQAVGYLRDALRNPDPSVRLMVVESVIGTPDGLPLLQEASSDSEESVRSSASRGLKEALAGQQ